MRGVIAILALLPVMAHAEGGVLTLDCVVVGASDTVQFQFAPTDVAADGTGQYTVTKGAQTLTAMRLSTEGPFVWSSGPAQISSLLLARGETLFTYLTFDAAQTDGTQGDPLITYLDCGVV